MIKYLVIFSDIIVTLLIVGCSSVGSYQSKEVTENSLRGDILQHCVKYEGTSRNPVIVIHGFLGAKLRNMESGTNVWGEFNPLDSIFGYSDEHLRELACTMSIGSRLNAVETKIEPYSFLEMVKIQFMGLQVNVNAYEDLLAILRKSGYVQCGKPLPPGKHFYSLYPYYYDWRRDLPYNAAKLHEYILKQRALLQLEYEKLYGLKNYDIQFDIVAHSMGGLLAGYYLRYGDADLPADGSTPAITWKGSNYIDKVLIVGTPNAGFLDTCQELIYGLQVAPGTPVYPPAVLGTFATYYQMMPTYGFRSVLYDDDPNGAEVDIFDPQVWIKMNWGLANPEQDKYLKILLPDVKDQEQRRQIALEHLSKSLRRAKQFSAAMQVKARPPDNVALFLFAGDAIETSRTAYVNKKTGEFKVVEYAAGDGKILTSSALFDLREDGYWTPHLRSPITWHGTFMLNAAHMGITKSSAFNSNASFCLLVTPSVKQDKRDKKTLDQFKPNIPKIDMLGDGISNEKNELEHSGK
jgi:pimeloyl-ACP methyl ester carboxylesterase